MNNPISNNQISSLNNFAAHLDSKMMQLTEMISSVKELSLEIKQSLAVLIEKKNTKKTQNEHTENQNFDHQSLRFKQKLNLDSNEKEKVKNNNEVIQNNQTSNQKILEINHLLDNSISLANNGVNNINNNNNLAISAPNNSQSIQNPLNQQISNIAPKIPFNNMLPQNNLAATLPVQTYNNNLNQIPMNIQVSNALNNNLNPQFLTQQKINNVMTRQMTQNNNNQIQYIQLPAAVNSQNPIQISNAPLVNNQINSVPTILTIQNGISLGGSFNNLVNNQAQAAATDIYPVQNQSNIQVNSSNNQHKNKNNTQPKPQQKDQEMQKQNDKRIQDSIKKPIISQITNKSNNYPNHLSTNSPKPVLKHQNKNNNVRQSPPPRKSPSINKSTPQVKKPQPKKSKSPFLSNSFDNLEDDDVMQISASNHKAMQKSKQIQKKNDKSFDFDEEYDP